MSASQGSEHLLSLPVNKASEGLCPAPHRAGPPAKGGRTRTFTLAEREAIVSHSSALGLCADEYIRQTAADWALAWQCERETFHAMALRRGCTADEVVQRGTLTDSSR